MEWWKTIYFGIAVINFVLPTDGYEAAPLDKSGSESFDGWEATA